MREDASLYREAILEAFKRGFSCFVALIQPADGIIVFDFIQTILSVVSRLAKTCLADWFKPWAFSSRIIALFRSLRSDLEPCRAAAPRLVAGQTLSQSSRGSQ